MPDQLFANNAEGFVAASVAIEDTTIPLGAGEGFAFPSPAAGDFFLATLTDGAGGYEIVKVTTRTDDSLSVVERGQEGTNPRGWSVGDSVSLRLTQGTMESLPQKNSEIQAGLNSEKVGGQLESAFSRVRGDVSVGNFDTFLSQGFYIINDVATDFTNGPVGVGVNGLLEVTYLKLNHAVQRYTSHDTNDSASRFMWNGAWSAWRNTKLEHGYGNGLVADDSTKFGGVAPSGYLTNGTNTVNATHLAADSVGASEIAADAVRQSEIKTGNGTVSQSTSGNKISTHKTSPGGAYSLGLRHYKNGDMLFTCYQGAGRGTNTGYAYYIFLDLWADYGGSTTGYVNIHYVSASPPYDYGIGEVPLFMFAEINNSTKDIISLYVSRDPPWAYNGPTEIAAQGWDEQGRGYRNRLVLPHTMDEARGNPEMMAAYLDAYKNPSYEKVVIDQSIKNADMNLVPHHCDPSELRPDSTIVLLDPNSPVTLDLMEMHLEAGLANEGASVVNELIHDGYLILENDALDCISPRGVMTVKPRWKI